MNSLRQRILLATFGTILFFLLLAGVALDKAFQRVIRTNISENLHSIAFSLLATAEVDRNGKFSITKALPQSDITMPGSGLIALIIDHQSNILWRSPSALGEPLPSIGPISAGASHFLRHKGNEVLPFIYRFGTVWEGQTAAGKKVDQFLTFVMIQDKAAYLRQVKGYRETLIQWLGGGAIFILLIQGWLLLRELKPLRRVVSEIDAIEHGLSNKIKGQYPAELAMLTQRINRFIHNEREQITRYRHGLDDLAHSLKTPMAVIRGFTQQELDNNAADSPLQEQIARMTEIIDYQLKRAGSAGKNTLGQQQTPLKPVLEKTCFSLAKVYAARNIQHQINCEDDLIFHGDKDDLYEIVGNIVDNAHKWAHSLVRIHCEEKTLSGQTHLCIAIHDDGAGFSPESQQRITKRGVRADEQVPGQGIGLAVVQSIVQSYQGEMVLSRSNLLGGAQVTLTLPV